MAEKKTSERLLDIQKLQLDLKNHMEQDERVFGEFKHLLTSIDNKLTLMASNDNSHNTKFEVLKSKFDTHLDEHKQTSEKYKGTAVWLGIGLTIFTIIINAIMWALTHVSVN